MEETYQSVTYKNVTIEAVSLKILRTYVTSEDAISQEIEEEEEKEDRSELIIYENLPMPQTTTSIKEPCRNPPRDRRSPDRLTY